MLDEDFPDPLLHLPLFLSESRDPMLEDIGHDREKERDEDDRIDHRKELACCGDRSEVSESYRRRRDDREVESIKITPSLSSLEVVDEYCPDQPEDEDDSSEKVEFVMDAKVRESHRKNE